MFKNRIFHSIAFSALIMLIMTGCVSKLKIPDTGTGKYPGGGGPVVADIADKTAKSTALEDKIASQEKLQKFESLDELREMLENSPGHSAGFSYGLEMFSGRGVTNDMPTAVLDGSGSIGMITESKSVLPPGMEGEGSKDYSKTNVQIEGVDEADIIKTDGKYIYAVVKNNLFILSAYPAETSEVLTKIEFKSRPQDIYVNGDYLALYGRDNEILQQRIYKTFKRRENYTFVKVFDIKDRSNPKLVRTLDFEGIHSNSRMIGDYMYFVTTNFNYQYIENEPLLPRILENGELLSVDCKEGDKCLMPDIYYFNMPYESYNFTTITAINLKDSSKPVTSDVYLMNQNQNMFVSHNNIYLTYTKYISEHELEMEVLKEIVMPRMSEKKKDRILTIELVEDYILTPAEKQAKIARVIEGYTASLDGYGRIALEKELKEKMLERYKDVSKELEKTVIHKISIRGGNLEYKTFGKVTGNVLNQFSMDENNGFFRIATTKNRTWSKYEENNIESYNNLYVLDNDMKVVGSVENLAKGERIYSVRFMQDRAYMVTFKQTDPLFVIDLKNPKKPTVLGELKIPGFSNYLHPYDNNTLIGIGKDASLNKWGGTVTGGVKISLFDVSDVSKPREIDTYVLGEAGSDSIALQDHKAFLFSREKNLLVFPVSLRGSTGNRRLTFSGAAVFNVDTTGFTLLGKIDHSDGGQASSRDYWRGYSYYDNTVKRSLYIEDVLYTFSNNYIGINKIKDLELIKNLSLIKDRGPEDDFTIIN